jgi:hypothetical protein
VVDRYAVVWGCNVSWFRLFAMVSRSLGSILVAWPSPSSSTFAAMTVAGKRRGGVKTMADTRQKLADSLQVHRDASNSVGAQAMMAMVWQHMEEKQEEVAST